MNGEPLTRELRPAHVLRRGRDAGNQHANLSGRFHAGRDGIQHVPRHDFLLHDVLHVDRRRLSRHGDGLGQRPDAHLDAHVCRKRRGQFDPFPLHRAEARKGERHRIHARPQVDDLVLTRAVGDGRANFLDQGRTRRFNGHAGDHGAAAVLHDAGNGAVALSRRHRRTDDDQADDQHASAQDQSVHYTPPSGTSIASPERTRGGDMCIIGVSAGTSRGDESQPAGISRILQGRIPAVVRPGCCPSFNQAALELATKTRRHEKTNRRMCFALVVARRVT